MSERSAERTAERAAVPGPDNDTADDSARQPLTERIQSKPLREFTEADDLRRETVGDDVTYVVTRIPCRPRSATSRSQPG